MGDNVGDEQLARASSYIALQWAALATYVETALTFA